MSNSPARRLDQRIAHTDERISHPVIGKTKFFAEFEDKRRQKGDVEFSPANTDQQIFIDDDRQHGQDEDDEQNGDRHEYTDLHDACECTTNLYHPRFDEIPEERDEQRQQKYAQYGES